MICNFATMQIRLLDLDGSLLLQRKLQRLHRPAIGHIRNWGPRVRLACGFGRFHRFEKALIRLWHDSMDRKPAITFYGSGDFHHVTLALLRRQPEPINLLVIDNHPDWMRGVPFLHCGTWLRHAANLPQVRRIFHVAGDVDFDNYYRWLAPWNLLTTQKITVFPAYRTFRRGGWARVANEPIYLLSPNSSEKNPKTQSRLRQLLAPFLRELGSLPLYISFDKDVLVPSDAVVNWDSGRLSLPQARVVLETFLTAAGGKLAGMDIVGDWSPVESAGMLARFLSIVEHPVVVVDPLAATETNEQTNLALLETILEFENERDERRRDRRPATSEV